MTGNTDLNIKFFVHSYSAKALASLLLLQIFMTRVIKSICIFVSYNAPIYIYSNNMIKITFTNPYNLLPVFLILSLLFTGCSKNAVEILRLEYGGGFSGDKTTYILKNDRTVTKSKKLSDEQEAEIGKISKKSDAEVKYLTGLLINNFSERTPPTHGNITRTFKYSDSGEMWERTWAPGTGSEYSGDLIFSQILSILTEKENIPSPIDSPTKKIENEIH